MDATRELLASGLQFDAVLALNDTPGTGVLRALGEAGCRVPDDVAVIGFDNIENGRFTLPSLSSVDPRESTGGGPRGRERRPGRCPAGVVDAGGALPAPRPARGRGVAEQAGGEVGERVLPRVPPVRALAPPVELVLHARLVEEGDRAAHRLVGGVGDAAVAQAQQRGALVDGLDVQVGGLGGKAGREGADVREPTGPGRQEPQGLATTHGQPRQDPPVTLVGFPVPFTEVVSTMERWWYQPASRGPTVPRQRSPRCCSSTRSHRVLRPQFAHTVTCSASADSHGDVVHRHRRPRRGDGRVSRPDRRAPGTGGRITAW
ncbi:substrate-binding domain-containing protein [Kineococcus indalonis]|uniref:substrate-binding domain-containing protein n=1 Tax=Kineococcus indalonis TaxID=2696566 RepID=UPI002B1BE2EF|nr:substrate-binding domain-containing protein [Kineococcus indalonis]